jgi:hypothetical protein
MSHGLQLNRLDFAQLLLQYRPFRAMPIINVGDDQPDFIQFQFAPAGNRRPGSPRQGRRPTQRPIGADRLPHLLDVMEFELRLGKKPIDHPNHLLIPRNPPKFGHRVFEIHVGGVQVIALVDRETGVIFPQALQNVHRISVRGVFLTLRDRPVKPKPTPTDDRRPKALFKLRPFRISGVH